MANGDAIKSRAIIDIGIDLCIEIP